MLMADIFTAGMKVATDMDIMGDITGSTDLSDGSIMRPPSMASGVSCMTLLG